MPDVKRTVVIVTGSRDYKHAGLVIDELDLIDDRTSANVLLLHGNAPGADALAAEYAESELGWHVIPLDAQWNELQGKAGPIRNAHMVTVAKALRQCGWEVEGLAFPLPESRGTWDCVRKMRSAEILVKVLT